jgi:hypothetical protein
VSSALEKLLMTVKDAREGVVFAMRFEGPKGIGYNFEELEKFPIYNLSDSFRFFLGLHLQDLQHRAVEVEISAALLPKEEQAALRAGLLLAVQNKIEKSKVLLDDAARGEGERVDEEVGDVLVLQVSLAGLESLAIIAVIPLLLGGKRLHLLVNAISDRGVEPGAAGCLREDAGCEQQHCRMEDIVMDAEQRITRLQFFHNFFLGPASTLALLLAIHPCEVDLKLIMGYKEGGGPRGK